MHERFEHVAVFHRGVDDLVSRLGPWLTNNLAAGDAVLLCVEDQSAAAVRDVLSTHAGPITVVPADVRYERPASAVRLLFDAVQRSLRDGATRLWSIGRIERADDEGRWARYEAAVDDVLGDLPVVGVCAFDTSRLSDEQVVTACRSHRHLLDGADLAESPSYAPWQLRRASSDWVPVAPADVELPASELAAARATFSHLADAAGFGAPGLIDVQIVVTELATNAVVHGGPPAVVRLWRQGRRLVVQTVDHGPGLHDPWPDLRPRPAGTVGGLGLWMVGQLTDRFCVDRGPDGETVVSAAVDAP